MSIKRLTSEEERQKIKDSKKHKGKSIANLSNAEKDELLEIVCKKLGIL